MRKSFFTKAIVAAGVMASAMVLSSMAVFAAGTSTLNFTNANTIFSAGEHYFDSSGNVVDTENDAYFTVYANGDRRSSSTGEYLAVNSNSDYVKFTISEEKANVTLNVTAGSSNKTFAITTPTGGSADPSPINIAKNAPNQDYIVALSGSGEYKINFNSGSIKVYSIKVEEISDSTPKIKTNLSNSSIDVVGGKTTSFTATLLNPGKNTTIGISAPNATSATFTKDETITESLAGTVNVTVPSTSESPITVTLSADGAEDVEITINVVDAALTVDPTSLEIYKGASASFTASVNTGDSINVSSSNPNDVTATLSGNTVTVAVASNTTAESATITVTAGSLSQTVNVIIKAPISVTPTKDGSTYTYTFTGKKGNVLTTDKTLAENTAYASNNENTSVEFIEAGAQLTDNSDSAAAELRVPIPNLTSGKITIEGSITPTNATGSNWALVSIGDKILIGADSATDKDKTKLLNAAIATSLSGAVEENAGSIAKGKTLTYSLTIDFDSKTFSGTLTNENTNETATYENISFDEISTYEIIFKTNGGGSGDKARTTVIPSVKYTVENTVETPEFVTAPTTDNAGAIKADGEFYAYALVSAGDLANYSGVTFSMGNSSVTVTEVYKTVTFDSGDLTDPNGKYMAIIYTDSENADNITSKVTYTFDTQA